MDRLPDDTLDHALAALPDWTLATDRRSIRRELRFDGFPSAFAFMAAVALEAQALDHHPDWSNSYSAVTITLHTYAAGGLTALDLDLATRIDRHAAGRTVSDPGDACR